MPDPVSSPTRVPRATYRFQFNEQFRLSDALGLVPYLHELGISHIYASPWFKACPHSRHGYDVSDFSRLNPELGTEADLARLATALRERRMGLVLDIVPNHMGIADPANAWWWDVLKNGRASRFAGHFDIDWESSDPRLRGKVFVPVLGESYDRALEKTELQIHFDRDEFTLRYHDYRFPLAPASVAGLTPASEAIREINTNPAALDRIIRGQHYGLGTGREGDSALNYRRFFAVNSLAALRVEDERVFNDVHVLVRRWLDEGVLEGLRVDHPDGLRNPGQYQQRLHRLAPDAWLIVEKILMPDETLPVSWPVAGTTGYDFLNRVNGIFIKSDREKAFTDFYIEFTGESADYPAVARDKKRFVLDDLFVTEVKRLTGLLTRIAARYPEWLDLNPLQLREALTELAAVFPVYRTYIHCAEDETTGKTDVECIEKTIAAARQWRRDLPAKPFDFLGYLLRQNLRGEQEDDFVARFQQLTGPVMAKGVEDTAFYTFNRFASLNEVGGDPGNFGHGVEAFHEFCRRQQLHWPDTMLCTSTHDTKRSEDVRARLNLLTEIPETWFQAVQRWSALNQSHRRNGWPDHNTEYLFYQTLVGAWPLPLDRALAYMEKATCEAGQHTGWKRRNAGFDSAVRDFVTNALNHREFMRDVEHFVAALADSGFINSLAQTLIKLTAPGVPDIYQGTELWEFSLVDPDNRRAVDFELRRRLLAVTRAISAEQAWQRRGEGLAKMWMIRQALRLRAQHPAWFAGDYVPLTAGGTKAQQVIAFRRSDAIMTVVPRFVLELTTWGDTGLPLPPGHWRNAFTGEQYPGDSVALAVLFQRFPVALLINEEAE